MVEGDRGYSRSIGNPCPRGAPVGKVLLAGTVLLAKVPTERAPMTMEMRMGLENMVNGRGDSGTRPEVREVGESWW